MSPGGRGVRPSVACFFARVLACACALALASCEGPAALPTVRVRVAGISSSVARYDISGTESVTVWAVFRTPEGMALGPYQMRADAGPSANPWDVSAPRYEVRRAIYWARTDPFAYEVQVPPVAIGEVRVFVTAGVICGGTGVVVPRERLLASGRYTERFTPTMERATDVDVTVTRSEVDCTEP